MSKINYTRDFAAFYRDKIAVEGAYGPRTIVPAFLEQWIRTAFPPPDGNPAARNILDARTKKQGKSALAAAVALYMASRQEYAEIPIVAADQDQSRDRVLRAVKFAVENGPLGRHAKVYRDVIELDNHSVINAMSNDWKGAAGGNYPAVIFDELHVYTYENQRRLFDEMVIPPTVKAGVRWMATYAGFEGESKLLREWWNLALTGRRIHETLPIYSNNDAGLLAFIDVGEASWRMPWITPEYIAQTKVSERPNTFRRLWLNEWVSNESQFLPEGAWDACCSLDVKPLAPGERAHLVLGADASTTRDLTALVGTSWNPETRTTDVRFVRVWKPVKGFLRKGKPTVDLSETIGAEVLKLYAAGCVDAVVYDPYQLHSIAVEWEKKGIRTIELPQSAGRTEADQALYDAVISRTIRHYGDPTLTEHLHNAVAIETPRGLRLAKEKTSLKIDASVALSMSRWGSDERQAKAGEVSAMPNLFYEYEGADPETDFMTVGGRMIYAPGYSRSPHPPGVHWYNCPRRNRGCLACVEEMDAPGGENERLAELDRQFLAGR